MKYFRFLIIFSSIFLQGCCSKKLYSNNFEYYNLKINILHYPGRFWAIRNDITQKIAIDSIEIYSNYQVSDTIKRIPIKSFKNFGLNKFALILKNSTRQDTISEISFQLSEQKTSCGKCFPFGKGSQTSEHVADFKIIYKNRVYKAKEVIGIE